MKVVLYGRVGCHLCEAAEDAVAAALPEAVLVTIDDRADLLARYGLRVPVLEVAGRVVAEGRIDEAAIRAAVAALRGSVDAGLKGPG